MPTLEKAIDGAREVFAEAFLAKIPSFVKISPADIKMRQESSGEIHFDVPKYVGEYRTKPAADAAVSEVAEYLQREVLSWLNLKL